MKSASVNIAMMCLLGCSGEVTVQPSAEADSSESGAPAHPNCSAGITRLATGPGADGLPSMALDATHAYWSVADGVWRVPKGGGAVEQVATGTSGAGYIAVDDGRILFTERASSQLLAAPKAGGRVEYIWHEQLNALFGQADAYFLRGIATSDHALVVVAQRADEGWIVRQSEGGELQKLAHGAAAGAVAVAGNQVFWVSQTPGDHEGAIQAVSLGSGDERTVASHQRFGNHEQSPHQLVADSRQVVWGTDDGRVVSIDVAGVTSQTLAFMAGSIDAVALDDTHVYFTFWDDRDDYASEGLYRVKREGGEPEAVAVGRTRHAVGAHPVVVDSRAVYWISEDAVYGRCK